MANFDIRISGGIDTEIDPVFVTSPAASLTSQNLIDLGNLSGVNTGDKAHVQEGQTVGAVQITLTNSKAITDNTTQAFEATIVAIQSASTGAGTVGDVFSRSFFGTIKRIAGVTSIVDTVSSQDIALDLSTVNLVVDFSAGAGVLEIKPTGELNKTFEWKADLIFTEQAIA